jgi:2,5-diketo-D-gluconate reductase A
MTQDPRLALNDGRAMPQLGFGVWRIPDEDTADIVGQAIEAGYRLIDTAMVYRNEAGVGRAVAGAGVARDELFITTKLANMHQGHDQALRAFDASLGRLALDYVDLYLIHWPLPAAGRYLDTWRALIRLKDEGRVRSIGVSNFTPEHLGRLIEATGITPAINQIELHPRFQQRAAREFHARHGIVTQSWSPLGRGHLVDHPALAAIGAQYGKSWAQVVIRWHLQSGLAVIPKSVTRQRIRDNRDVFDFALSADDLVTIAALDDAEGRDGGHPDVMAFDFGPPGIRHAKRLLRRIRHRIGV